ncbi:hypothetical protein [Polymorphobacter fuscus]|uniref:Glycosyltransferase n=1 Tax=Sandarakinorhabdus fusca TaxID=1439888 RepID=A0A7C9GMF9_9SPHN|nr:hypothetical protein [Polymorphobacter fuscus]KAB7648454.1 hypothetical protein F9290_01700 [Polymorphobacter fuscus]MQT15977.1 hypothetical protein [Polymorphobacter fuscus]NJC07746.1 hypothetical protein [Polymorphobacter fuscus]
MFETGRRYAFHAHRYGQDVASNRLRMFAPLAALRRRGLDVELFDPARGARGYDAIVFSRGFSPAAVHIARAARADNRRIIVDVCDNMFALAGRAGFRGCCNRLREMMALADVVTAPTAMMAAQLEAHGPGAAFRVIPDALETIDPCPVTTRAHGAVAGLEQFLGRHSGALHCVWYGSSVPGMSGFAHLDGAVRELESFGRRHPVTLTVISDTRLRYWLARRHWRIPSVYLPFGNDSFGPALARHHVAVIPVGRNGYTSGKSINRAATAVMAGLGVVADPLPSYEELRPWIVLGDWQAGLAHYADCLPATDPALPQARRHLEARYGADAVAGQWEAVLDVRLQ